MKALKLLVGLICVLCLLAVYPGPHSGADRFKVAGSASSGSFIMIADAAAAVVVPAGAGVQFLDSDNAVPNRASSSDMAVCGASDCDPSSLNVIGFKYDNPLDMPALMYVNFRMTGRTSSGTENGTLSIRAGTCGSEGAAVTGGAMDVEMNATEDWQWVTSAVFRLSDGECVVIGFNDDGDDSGFTFDGSNSFQLHAYSLDQARTPTCHISAGASSPTLGTEPCVTGSLAVPGDASNIQPTMGQLYARHGIVTNCGSAAAALTLPTPEVGAYDTYTGMGITVINCSGNTLDVEPPSGLTFQGLAADDCIRSTAEGDSVTILFLEVPSTGEIHWLSNGFVDGGASC